MCETSDSFEKTVLEVLGHDGRHLKPTWMQVSSEKKLKKASEHYKTVLKKAKSDGQKAIREKW